MTLKEYFDMLVQCSETGLFPASQTYNAYTVCRYKTEDGKKCAIGILIPDERYSNTLEGLHPSDQSVIDAIGDNFPIGLNIDDLRTIQRLHDSMQNKWNHELFIEGLASIPSFKKLLNQ